MRGTQLVQFHPSEPRLIPAGAGNTRLATRENGPVTVYPRWRGEHTKTGTAVRTPAGLSPLARGTLVACIPTCTKKRFIPAGAGNTDTAYEKHGVPSVYPRWRGEHR